MPKANSAPLGCIRLAKQFLDSAIKVQKPATSYGEDLAQPISLVAYYLVGHSVELSLKSFLLGRGMPITTLRSRKYGHNLTVLLAESRKRKLGLCSKLTAKDVVAIKILDECYSVKELEYSFNGARRLPNYPTIIALATKLQREINVYCLALAW
jgi:hypothetical protein